MRPKRLGLASSRSRSSSAAIIGVVVSEMTRLIITEADRVTANSRNSRPTMPPMNRSGMNTATRLIEIETTVKPTSRAPRSAASSRGMPSSTWRTMFSRTTMASSTTNPVATVSAISDRLLSENPAMYITPSVPSSETTTATAGTTVARHDRRKIETTMTTRMVAIASVISTSRSEARIVVVRSLAISIEMSAGRPARKPGSCALTASTAAMMFAPGWRLMTATIAGRPLNRPTVRASSGPSVTSAMSDRRTAAPLR